MDIKEELDYYEKLIEKSSRRGVRFSDFDSYQYTRIRKKLEEAMDNTRKIPWAIKAFKEIQKKALEHVISGDYSYVEEAKIAGEALKDLGVPQ